MAAVPHYEILCKASQLLPALTGAFALGAGCYMLQRKMMPAAVSMDQAHYAAEEQTLRANPRQGSPTPVEMNPWFDHNMTHKGFFFWGTHPKTYPKA